MSTVHTNIFLRIIIEIIRDNHVLHLERTGVFKHFLSVVHLVGISSFVD